VRLQKLDRAWYRNIELDPNKPFHGEAFNNIECMLLERFYNLYVLSEFSEKFKLVNMGKLTVDL
jgi:hypothetical protein